MTELTPIRRGRCAGAGNWQTQYQALQMTAREAAELIRDGDTAAFAAMSNWPWELDGALAERLLETGGHIAIYGHFIPAGTRLLTPELAGQVTYDSNFYGVERGLEPMGNVHYAPSNLSQTPAWLLARRPRVAALTCSLPDENGWMSRSLWGTALSRKVLEQCELVLAEVNPRMPNIPSDGEAHTRIHVSEVDGIIESSRPLVETPIAAGNETDSRIAGYIADLVPDGACIQLGLGGLANTVGECLAHAGKRDLGVHTEILSTGVMELMRRGVVNNSRKQTCPGRSVYANMVGGPELWAFAHENPAFCQKEIDWVNDARNIARNDHVVSINNAMEIDLTGQVNAESIGPPAVLRHRRTAGVGGRLPVVQGRKEYPGPPVQLPGQGGGPPLQNRAAAGPRQRGDHPPHLRPVCGDGVRRGGSEIQEHRGAGPGADCHRPPGLPPGAGAANAPLSPPASCGCLDDLDKVPLFPGGALYCFAEFCGGGRKRSRKDLTFPGRLRRIKKLKRIRALV